MSSIALGGSANYDVDQLFRKYNQGHKAGVAVLVVKDGKTIHETGYGEANLYTHEKIDEHTRFNLASDSKQFTAVAALLLMDDKKLKLDDPVKKFLPEIPNAFKDVRVSDLIYHTSGFPKYTQENINDPADYRHMNMKPGPGGSYTNEGVLKFLSEHPHREFPAGAKFEYSDLGYVVLARLVEKISGKPHLQDFLQERVFSKIGMSETQYYQGPSKPIPHRAIGYFYEPIGRVKTWDQAEYDTIHGDGGVYSSISDLKKWTAALQSGALLKDKSLLKTMFEPGHLRYTDKKNVEHVGKSTDYAFGFSVDDSEQDLGTEYSHEGEWMGFKNILRYIPSQKTWIVLLGNHASFKPEPASNSVVNVLLRSGVMSKKPAPASGPRTAPEEAQVPSEEG